MASFKKRLRILVIVLVMCGASFAEDKCDPKYAKIDPNHTMCMKKQGCSEYNTLIKASMLDPFERMAILDVHNKLRNFVALGQIYGQPPAKNMRQLIWDEELATVAQRWAEQCRFEHDRHSQRKIDRFWYVGQNLAFEWRSPAQKDHYAPVINTTVKMFNEVHDPGFPSSQINPFVSKSGAGHYTQIAWANTEFIGCGSVIYKEHRQNMLGETKLIVCNFGPGGNVISTEMYAAGPPACEVFSNQYPGLCSTPEINQRFEAPCELEEFKARFAILCGDDVNFSKTFGIQVSPSSKSAWIIVIIVLVLLICLGVSGFIVYKLHQNGKITMPDIHFDNINLRSWRQ